MKKIKLAPSLMCADLLHLADELRLFEEFGIDLLHIDIMDGHYVPNYTLGTGFCDACRRGSSIPLDVHLMIERVEDQVVLFCEPGSRVTFHPEVCRHPVRVVQQIRERGAVPSIAISPDRPIEAYRHLLPLVEQVCVMTVCPGFAGQDLLPFCLDKIAELRRYADENDLSFDIEVDGNVSWKNIPPMVRAGANVLVTGTSSIFSNTSSRRESTERLRVLIDSLEASPIEDPSGARRSVHA